MFSYENRLFFFSSSLNFFLFFFKYKIKMLNYAVVISRRKGLNDFSSVKTPSADVAYF